MKRLMSRTSLLTTEERPALTQSGIFLALCVVGGYTGTMKDTRGQGRPLSLGEADVISR